MKTKQLSHLVVLRDPCYNSFFVAYYEEFVGNKKKEPPYGFEVLWEGIGFKITRAYDLRDTLVELDFALQRLIKKRGKSES